MRQKKQSPGRAGTRHGAIGKAIYDGAETNPLRPPLQVLRFQRDVEALHRLGPRPVGEFVAELIDQWAGDDPERVAFAEARLSCYAALDPGIVAALGGDCFPPQPMTLIAVAST